MTGARFVGYGIGMFAAARDPHRNRTWIDTMILIQALDWIATIAYLAAGDVTLRNVTTAAFLPPVFIVALLAFRTRRMQGLGKAAASPNPTRTDQACTR